MSTGLDLEGKTIVVTGGSMGIGRACAAELLRRGAEVVACARGEVALATAVRELEEQARGRIRGVPCDVTDEAGVERLFASAERNGTLWGVIHAAGIYGPIGPVAQVDAGEWLGAIRVNLFGAFLVAREACRRLIARRSPGSLVLLAGGGAASPFPNYSAYAASKAATVRLAETLAQEVADHGIRVNTLAPGFVATRLHQKTFDAGPELAGSFLEDTKSRLSTGGVPVELAAEAAAFLLSERSAGITGRFLAAPYDSWKSWPEHRDEFQSSDLFTLRRIVPKDRQKNWQ